jgi:HD superfamily phosphohydrolase
MDHFAIRDPIHEWIKCSPAEKGVLNSPLVQRLKWVMQLSLVNQVFNGGTHSRFSHSLGAMKIAGEYMKHLFAHSPLNDADLPMEDSYYIQVARLAGLLHDIGHGPFSHSFDHTVYQQIYKISDGGHDIARFELIKSNLLAPYIEKCGVKVEHVAAVWESSEEHQGIFRIIHAVVEGPLGADRIDFTRRDAYYTGTQQFGTFPYHRIIDNSSAVKTFRDDSPYWRLTYNFKCIRDINRALDGRLCLYHDVYFHKTSMAASILVEDIMQLVSEPLGLEELVQDPHQFCLFNDTTMMGMVLERRNFLRESSETKETIEKWQNNLDKARELCHKLMIRVLPKMKHEELVTDLKKRYDEKEYAKKWFPTLQPSEFRIVKTRVISGISARKFDQYEILFRHYDRATEETTHITCAEALEKIGYTPSQKPYYLVRGYLL